MTTRPTSARHRRTVNATAGTPRRRRVTICSLAAWFSAGRPGATNSSTLARSPRNRPYLRGHWGVQRSLMVAAPRSLPPADACVCARSMTIHYWHLGPVTLSKQQWRHLDQVAFLYHFSRGLHEWRKHEQPVWKFMVIIERINNNENYYYYYSSTRRLLTNHGEVFLRAVVKADRWSFFFREFRFWRSVPMLFLSHDSLQASDCTHMLSGFMLMLKFGIFIAFYRFWLYLCILHCNMAYK